MDLKNKRILITGGTSGLGFELAVNLLSRGAHIFICSRTQEEIDKALIRLNSENVRGYVCDISNILQVQTMAMDISNLDGLINNAGVWLEGNVENNSAEEISNVIDVNLKGLIYCTNVFLPALKKREESFIVNIASTSSVDIKPKQAVYTATKWGVKGFTDSLRLDLRESGVKVIGVYPGGMRTNLFSSAGSNRDTSTFIDPKLIAEEIAHILEQDKSFLTDSVIFRRPNPVG